MENTTSRFIKFCFLLFLISCVYTAFTFSFLISTFRLCFSLLFPLLISIRGVQRQSLSLSGSILGVIVGFLLTLAHVSYFFSLLAFFVSSSKITNWGCEMKKKLEGSEFKEGGQRNWIQVFCNGGMAAQCSLFSLIIVATRDLPLDFHHHFVSSYLSLAVLGSLACSNGDSWSSEIGSVYSKEEPVLITTFQRVPRGTNGGISSIGLIASFLGGTFVGIAHYIGIYLFCSHDLWDSSPSQLHYLWYAALSGLTGSALDSFLGATLQYSGLTPEGVIVDIPGKNIKTIAGRHLLDNHGVNLLSNVLTGILLPLLPLYFLH